MAGNVGQPIFKVSVLDGSPFNGIPQQEWSYYFTQDNFDSLTSAQGIQALPPPWNGLRCAENMENYDNFLIDINGNLLEKAVNATGSGLASRESALLVNDLEFARSNANPASTTDYAAADSFFTWMALASNFFQSSNNPNALTFDHMNEVSNQGPKWMYAKKVKGDGATNPSILSPFMNNLPNDPKKGVHWGCATASVWPVLQPFEILYFNDGNTHEISPETPALQPRTNIYDNNFNIDISKRAYLALSFGGTASTDGNIQFMILLARGTSPRMYKIGSSNSNVTLISVFQGADGEDFFTPNTTNMTLKVEPVAFGMIITSNLFGGKPWIVNVTDSGGGPMFMGGDHVYLYSGNVKAGFAIRPVQYAKGVFVTAGQPVEQDAGDNSQPTFTTAMKGAGSNQAARAANGNDIHAVDADTVNGQKVFSFIDSIANSHPGGGTGRKIDFVATTDPDVQVSNKVKTTTFSLQVTLTPGDVPTGGSFTIKNGRTPYIWQIRGSFTPADKGGGGAAGAGTDISCAVLSCDLSWSASSFIEFSHTGTLKLLMRPDTGVPIPDSYANRALYITIDAYWLNGQDGGNESQRLFTGMSVGSSIDVTAETKIMTLQLEDYMNALEGCKFTLSPYYDGMVAKLAVKDIVKQLGLSDSDILIDASTDPTDYGLPFNNPFEEPQFRFKMGASLKSGVMKIAELDLKSVFFDVDGKFHYDAIPGGSLNNQDLTPTQSFVTSPKSGTLMQVVWNTISSGRHVNDVFNVISVGTVDKNTGEPIYLHDAFNDSISDPSSVGYLGYRKHLIINDPAIGSAAAAGRYLSTYRDRVKIPPYTYKFETYGRGGLQPLSIVTIDGALARVMNTSMHADAKENNWWMNVECEWFDSAL